MTPDRTPEQPLEQRPEGWDRTAAVYEDTVERVTSRYAARMFDYANVGAGTDHLDLAAGTGVVALEAARRGANVLAVDFSPLMVDRLRQRAASEGLASVNVEVMDCQALNLPDASRDIVTCNFGAMFFPRAQAGFNKMCRVLRPGGTAIVTTWTAPPNQGLVRLMRTAMAATIDGFEVPKNLPNIPFTKAEQLIEGLTKAGFAHVDVHTITEPWTFARPEALEDLVRTNPGFAGIHAQIGAERVTAVIAAAIETLRNAPDDLIMEAHMAVATKA